MHVVLTNVAGDSWEILQALHGDVSGRAEILGGEAVRLVASMPNPYALRNDIASRLAEGGRAEPVGTIQLSLVEALTAVTRALAGAQKEVQRYS